ncbi:MAG: hypothetical protein ACI9D0_000379 [Bacteroidia bacterium]|jgi:hypothetical protein
MKLSTLLLSTLAALALGSGTALAEGKPWELSFDQPAYALNETVLFTVSGEPGQFGFLLLDPVSGTSEPLPGIFLDIALSANVLIIPMTMPASGAATIPCQMNCDMMAQMTSIPPLHFQAVSLDGGEVCVSEPKTLHLDATHGDCGPCNECDGGVTFLTMRHVSEAGGYVEAVELGKHDEVKEIYFAKYLEPYEVFSFTGKGKDNKLKKNLTMMVDGQVAAELHTSCSQPIAPGLKFGNFFVIAAESKNGGSICPETQSTDDDCSAGKPSNLEFTYTGGDCSASDNEQDAEKATCAGDPNNDPHVFVRAYGKKGVVYFDGEVDLNASFWIDAPADGKLDNNMFIELSDGDGNVIQTVGFHVSCSQPIGVGDIFGAMSLTGYLAK